MKKRNEEATAKKVVSLEKKKYARMVLTAFDALDHEDKRERRERRAEIEYQGKKRM